MLGSAQTRKTGACFEDLGDRALPRTVESLLWATISDCEMAS
jgi:hypothetical protein